MTASDSGVPTTGTVADREQAILEERARALARPVAISAPTGESHVVFSLAREQYVVPSAQVLAVFRLPALVRLPGAHPPVVGLTAWRGDVLTLLDVRSLVGAPPSALDDLALVVVLGDDTPEFGLLADRVLDAVHLAPADLLPLAGRTGAAVDPVLRGVTRDGQLVLDADALLRRQRGTHAGGATPSGAAPPASPALSIASASSTSGPRT